MKIALSAESTCDLTKEILDEFNIKTLPYHIILRDEEYLDGENISSKELFEYVDKTGVLPKTAALTVGEYEDYFNNLLKTHDAVIHFSLSSNLTSSTNNAMIAGKNCGNVYVIDSKSLSTGIGLLCLSCRDKINQGLDAKEIVNQIQNEVPKVQASFIVNTLKYLHKGGRCSAVALLGANLLSIKPKISVVDGKMQVAKKYMGKLEIVLSKYVDELLSEGNINKKRVFLTYSSKPAGADKVKQKLIDYGFENIYETQAGATICSHCGKDTLGVLFLREK